MSLTLNQKWAELSKSESLPVKLAIPDSTMTYTITNSIKVSDELTILYVKQQSGQRTRSVIFTVPKARMEIVESDYDKTPNSRVRISPAFEHDPDEKVFSKFCADFSNKITLMRDLMEAHEGLPDMGEFMSPLKEGRDGVVIYLKIKDPKVKRELEKPESALDMEVKLTFRVNCLWLSSAGKSGLSLDLLSFQPL